MDEWTEAKAATFQNSGRFAALPQFPSPAVPWRITTQPAHREQAQKDWKPSTHASSLVSFSSITLDSYKTPVGVP